MNVQSYRGSEVNLLDPTCSLGGLSDLLLFYDEDSVRLILMYKPEGN